MNKINKLMTLVALSTSCFSVNAAETITPYIIGGEKAVVENFKSYTQIRIQEYDYDSSFHYQTCGGSIINNQFILTAAHCLTNKVQYRYETTDPEYVFDDPNTDFNEEENYNFYYHNEVRNLEHVKIVVKNTNQHDVHMSELKAVDTVFIPDAYFVKNATQIDSDIAIIKLKHVIKEEDNVSQITLPDINDDLIYNTDLPELELVGLGIIRQDYDNDGNLISQASPEYLQYSTVKLLPDNYEYSSSLYPSDTFKCDLTAYDSDTRLCVIHPGFEEDKEFKTEYIGAACRGDSGGPLYWNHNGTQKQVGVVSSGAGNCSDIAGNYFTEIEHYLPWINGVISTESTPYTANLSGYDPLLDDGNTHSEGDNGFVADPITDGGTDGNTDGGGGGGGSTGLFTLLGLGLLGLQRRKNK